MGIFNKQTQSIIMEAIKQSMIEEHLLGAFRATAGVVGKALVALVRKNQPVTIEVLEKTIVDALVVAGEMEAPAVQKNLNLEFIYSQPTESVLSLANFVGGIKNKVSLGTKNAAEMLTLKNLLKDFMQMHGSVTMLTVRGVEDTIKKKLSSTLSDLVSVLVSGFAGKVTQDTVMEWMVSSDVEVTTGVLNILMKSMPDDVRNMLVEDRKSGN